MINILLSIVAFVGTYVLCYHFGGETMRHEAIGQLSWCFIAASVGFWLAISRLFKGSK